MTNNPDKANEKLPFFEKLMDFRERDFRFMFWSCSLLTIPVFAYMYSLSISLFVGLISSFFGLHEKHIAVLTKIGVLLSFLFAFGTQFYLWKLYRKTKAQKDKAVT